MISTLERRADRTTMTDRLWQAGLLAVLLVYLHNTLPYLTMMPRVNVDEPWLMERAYQVMRTGVPSQPMLGLNHAYLLQVGYGYLGAFWMTLFGVGIIQARLLGVFLGLGIVLMTAWIGRRTIDPVTGLGAALFLALDSNFLGGVRNARTDIPSVFFIVAAFVAYLQGRHRSRVGWFVCAGACLGVAVLCHGNAFWAGLILLAWYLLDYRSRALIVPYGYAALGGFLSTFGPYLAVVLTRWRDVQVQIGNFAGDRVPAWRPSVILHQMMLEVPRYRGWYFGLITNTVPNPLLWVFQLLTIAGVISLIVRALRPRSADASSRVDPRGPVRLLVLVLGSVLIFAGFINNKVPVYLPHLLVGFALAAGFAVSEGVYVAGRMLTTWQDRLTPDRAIAIATCVFVVGYGGAGIAYYEKWYSSVRKSELVSYESTATTLRALVPAGPKYVYASPQFWTPFHAEPGTTFHSYAAAQPVESGSTTTLNGVSGDRPIFLVVDEYQWLPELIGTTSSTVEWQRAWIGFIERRCALDAVAFGTAHGTMALYECALTAAPPMKTPRIVGGSTEYAIDRLAMSQATSDLAQWSRYEDPRRTRAAHPDVRPTAGGLRISGNGWPGIIKMIPATPRECYLVRTITHHTRDGDLLYLGTWEEPQVRSLSGASSAGIPAPLVDPKWFPRDRAFCATAAAVMVRVYSEAPETDFVVSSLDIYGLRPVPAAPGH